MHTNPATPSLHPYFKRGQRLTAHATAHASGGPWTVPDICAAYRWPKALIGGGVIAIVELGGGWLASDMATYFKSVDQPVPMIIDVSVDGTKNKPGDDADGEVALDIQLAAAAYFAATGHAATIRVYWAQDIAIAVRAAYKDGCDVCSISWGADEADWGIAAAQDMEQAAIEATAAGMVVFAASGDNDSGDGGAGAANVDIPAGCPHVIGCGGTNKSATSETVWNNNPGKSNGEGTGGGYSTIFPVQPWQLGAPPPPNKALGRMVPDISADADPNTGYSIFFQGKHEIVGGTSAVAPLFAGLFAAFGKKLGFVSPMLWQSPGCFVDITSGNNGTYAARPGPDACCGLGAPVGSSLASLFGHGDPPPIAPTPTPLPLPPPPPTVAAPTLVQAQKWVLDGMKHLPTNVHRSTAEAAAIDALAKHWPKG